MEPITSAILLKCLDGLTTRASATAQNIANAGSPGYRPVRVSFEESLALAAGQGPDAVAQVVPSTHFDPTWSTSDTLRLDLEITDAVMTSGRYNAVVEILNRHMQLSALAVSGGR